VNLNVAIIFITFLVGFEVDVEDNITHLTRTFTYQGITGIRWDLINWFSTDGWDAFSEHMQGLASVIFCYVNHQLVFPLVFDLKNPSKRRLDKIFNRVHVTEVIIYSLVGLSGYLLLVEHIDERDINAVVMSSIQTTFMSVGKCLMVVSLFFAVPLNLFPAREVVFESF
jgi:amino acid permease